MSVSVQTASSGTHVNVDEAGLERLVESLEAPGDFVIVHRDGDDTSMWQAAVAPHGGFAVEHRDHPAYMWTTTVASREEVATLVAGWVERRPGWADGKEWKRLDIEA